MDARKEPKIGCLVMAAGNAARFQENKLAVSFRGQSLISRALQAVPAELFSQVTVVTRYPRIAALAEEFGFHAVENLHPEKGISHTIALGTRAMAHCDGILYMVSDQPLLCRDSVARVVGAWKENPHCIIAAAHGDRRGNPCLFPKEFFPELLALEGDHGGNSVIRRHADRLGTVEVEALELFDVDTPKALAELEEQI